MIEYCFRKCNREDNAFIYKLKRQGFEWYLKDIIGWDENTQRDIIEKELDEHIDDMNIIQCDSLDIGLFTYYNDIDNKENIFIDMIVLLPEYRGKGIGARLLEFLISNNENKRIYLRTYKGNPARKLYRRYGFKTYKEEEHYVWKERC